MPHRSSIRLVAWLSALATAGALSSSCTGDASAERGSAEPRPADVRVATARTGSIAVRRTYLGEVSSLARAELAAGAAGAVRTVSVREGDRVERGDVLLVVDERLARAALDAARAASQASEAQAQQAERDAERFERAGPRTVAGVEIERAASELDRLAAARRNQEALAARARATLDRHRVTAPFDGVISRRMADPGDWVSEGTSVLELVADDELEVEVRAEPRLLEDVAVGHPATVTRGQVEVAAEVHALVPALDPATRTILLRIRPEASPPWLLAGDAVDVVLELEREGPGLIVPRDALVPGAVETRVVKVVDGKAKPVAVEIHDRGADEVRVTGEGLEAGDVLVVRGNERLRPDQPLNVVE